MQKKNILNRFKDVLGQYCAINQFVELSKRCFIADYDSEIHTRNSFIELATQKEITLTSYDSEYMINAISRSYIVNVHLCFETFLKEICNEIKNFGNNVYQEKLQEDSWLKCAVKNIANEKLSQDNQALFDLCEYYRLVRNTAVHDLCDVKSHKKEFRKLQNYNFKRDTKFASLIAPNEYEKISFDDFVMFSRSCVELATYLYNLVSYDYIKIINEIPQSQIARWKKYKPERCEKAIFAYINTSFRIDKDLESQISYLVDYVMAR